MLSLPAASHRQKVWSHDRASRHQSSEGTFACWLHLTRLEPVRISALNPDSGSFCSGLRGGGEGGALRSNCSIIQDQEVTVTGFALPSGSKTLLASLCSALADLQSCMDHAVPLVQNLLWLQPSPSASSTASPGCKEEIPKRLLHPMEWFSTRPRTFWN